MQSYTEEYEESLQAPVSFWRRQAADIAWFRAPEGVLDQHDDGTCVWFSDAELNLCHLAVDRHVERGRGDQVAFYYDSYPTGAKRQITFAELQSEVARFAGALRGLGLDKGDRVVIYMPMALEAAIAMLACARLGAVHSVVFGGFAPQELAARIDDAEPLLILTASCGIEFDKIIEYKPLVDQACEVASHKPKHVVVLQRPMAHADLTPPRDLDWFDIQEGVSAAECVTVGAQDPSYILYTSGTTGKPKGIVRDSGGYAVALLYALRRVYGMNDGDVWWGASDIGWVVGHSLIVYGPLIAGCSSVFFEGKPVRTPEADTFWRVISDYKVNGMFAAPTAFRAIRKDDPTGDMSKAHDLTSLRTLFVAGEKLDTSTYDWLCGLLNVPVVDHWWQTETGWPASAPLMGGDAAPVRLGSTHLPTPGYDIRVLDDDGVETQPGHHGHIVAKLPLPPGVAQSIWGAPERFRASYLTRFPGYYHTGDGGYRDTDGYLFITGRTDDVINVSGHRLSTGEMEEVVSSHPAVVECAVIAVADAIKGQTPVGLVVAKPSADIGPEELEAELVASVRAEIGALACFRKAVSVDRLPKTRSGKILRAVLRKIADGEPYETPATIDDPEILPEIERSLDAAGVRT
ncbi:MAG: AMP-binding protein [Pseudomonadota bacterium]